MHAVRWDRSLLGRCPLLFLLLLAPGDPPLPLGHSVRWERTLSDGRVPPFFWDRSVRRRHAQSITSPFVCLLVRLTQGVSPLLVGHAIRWEHMLPYRGVPPSP